LKLSRVSFELLRIVHGVSQEHVRRASACVQRLVYIKGGVELLDDLCFDEAVLLCAYLEKRGFKACRDYGVYRLSRLYGLALRDECFRVIKPMLRELRRAGTVCRIASNILKHWRGGVGRKHGDAYNAVDWAYRISSARDRLFSGRYPYCGGSGGLMVREDVQGDKYLIYARRICCRREERLEIPLKENLGKEVQQGG
jgi:hypothetical protein